MTAASRLAQLQSVHKRVHDLLDGKTIRDPLEWAYLHGAEEMIDFVLQKCPNGFGNFDDPLAQRHGFKLALVCTWGDDEIAEIEKQHGDVFVTARAVKEKRRKASARSAPASSPISEEAPGAAGQGGGE